MALSDRIKAGFEAVAAKISDVVASSVYYVVVTTGSEERPEAGMVVWVGGSSQPIEMIDGDVWYSELAGTPDEAPEILTTSLTTIIQGTAFTQTLSASGTEPITWSATGVPAGMTFSGGTLSGTPSGSGSYSIVVTTTNAAGTDSKTFTGTIGATGTVPEITTTSIAAMTVGVPYTQNLAANGSTPLTWGISAGTQPAGIGINSSTGTLSGTPTTAGSYTFTVQSSNTFGADTQVFTVTVASAVPSVVEHSVFTGTTAPFTLVRAEDGTPNIEIATGFYGSAVAGDLLTKVKLFIPAGTAPSSVAIRAYHPAVNGAPTLGSDVVATATISSPVAGAWNTATLNTPITLVNNRIVWVSYDAGAGVYYAATGAIPGGGPLTGADGYFMLADAQPYATGAGRRNHFRIGTGSTSPNTNTWYGLDVVVQET